MKYFLFSAVLLASMNMAAQDSTRTKTINVSGYAEIYYLYGFNKPSDGMQPLFLYSHNRHNEVNLNLGYIKIAHQSAVTRANLALGTGTYLQANYAAEPVAFRNVLEANAGVKLSKRSNLWLDAGILPSHIGFENAVSKDCPVLTRSLLAESSPYFEAGAKLTYTSPNEKWVFSGLVLNGWQRITRLSGNSAMSVGMQVQYKPNDRVLLNYSNFSGTDKPDSSRRNRLFHNLYSVFKLAQRSTLTLGFDLGTEQAFSGSHRRYTWLTPVAIYKQAISDKWSFAARAEYYQDPQGVIISTNTPNGFRTTGLSINFDFTPVKNAVLRIEGRSLHSKDPIFAMKSGYSKNYAFITSSIAVSFD
ncbi:MAG: porin [Bacteroidetes bacterium]|nr:porin [Bacteroidota bacterium]